MNTFFALALACTLSTAPNADNEPAVNETASYVVTDKVAIWLTDAGKLKLTLGRNDERATVELRHEKTTLYYQSVDLRKTAAMQTFDLSTLTQGTYQIRVTIGGQIISKTIQIESVQSRTCRLS